MHVQHHNRSTSHVSHEGVQYETKGDGVFEVPDDVAQQLLAFPHWSTFYGDLSGAESAEADSDAVEAELSPRRSRKA